MQTQPPQGSSAFGVPHVRVRVLTCLRVGKIRQTSRSELFFSCLRIAVLIEHQSRFIYALFIAVDANFRLKSKDKAANDLSLGSGIAYFVDNGPYKSYLDEVGPQVEVSSPYS